MNNDQKIRELMARLVSMSPEPPPYPEESPMVRHVTKKQRRPALVFVGAAALVAVLAVPLLLFTGEEGPVLVGSTTTSTSMPGTSTTVPPTSTTSAATPIEASGVVFLYQEPESSAVGNPALVPVPVTVRGGDEPDLLNAWQMVVEGLVGLPDGLSTAVPADVRVEGTRVEDGVVIAEMNEAFLNGASSPGLLSDFTMLNQLIYTLTHEAPEMRVQFTVGDEPVGIFGTEGIELTEPVDRESFRDWVHVIHLTEPIAPEADGTYRVEGLANVFEATLNLAVIDAEDSVIHDEIITASCGTGCWGDFSASLDGDLIVPGETSVMLFTYSAEDGSIVDALTVPIPEGGVWEYTVGD